MIKHGTLDVGNIKHGSADVQAVYHGTNKVWEKEVPWTPIDLPSLVSWYDPMDPSTITLEDTDRIIQWDDKSGNGFHLYQATGNTERPTLVTVGEQTYVQFNGAQRIQASNVYTGTNLIASMTCVFNGPSADARLMDNRGQGGTATEDMPGIQIKAWAANNALLLSGALANENVTVQYSTHPTSTFLLHAEGDAGSISGAIYINGVDDTLGVNSNGTVSTIESPFGLAIGGSANGLLEQFLVGDLGDAILCRTILSTEDRQKLEGYMAHKWGVADSLANDHPYKIQVPTV